MNSVPGAGLSRSEIRRKEDIALSFPVPARTPYAVKDSHVVPRKWTRVGPAAADHRINLQIGLKQSQFDELERHLCEVSDPPHHRYGQHLTSAEVDELVKPSDDALELVHDWLLDNVLSGTGWSITRQRTGSK
ncbi:MAG: tripeptidyl peptidase [Lasallia pustulata]|uniref:Tripeptidyl peptidase n=1 Tax=Lasallia pustulata TaxID=136370 RepID=A0A5M8PFF6_9LECA|nr:MAG: tripeptidyl peptidase [Lasallia pustulata]